MSEPRPENLPANASATASPLTAGERHAGLPCPVCEQAIEIGNPLMVCNVCGQSHHQACWAGECGSYECAPAKRDLDNSNQVVLAISDGELERAIPLPPSRPNRPSASATSTAEFAARMAHRPQRTSRLAVAAFICSLAAIPLFGLITGAVAVLLGALALAGIRHTREKGSGFAVTGIVLGSLAAAGWLIGLSMFMSAGQGGYTQQLADFRMTSDELDQFRPEIQRAMRANVLIDVGGRGLGSGVILQIDQKRAQILTNRHVVDLAFRNLDTDVSLTDLSRNLTVLLLGQTPQPARVEWVAPHGIDLALVSVPVLSDRAQVSLWPASDRPRIGDDAFAIGNPHALGWSYARGVISQFRTMSAGPHELQYIQTETAINPGNSGGGLYDAAGHLIGINTLTDDKRISEGLSFAISFEAVLQLLPSHLVKTNAKVTQSP